MSLAALAAAPTADVFLTQPLVDAFMFFVGLFYVRFLFSDGVRSDNDVFDPISV